MAVTVTLNGTDYTIPSPGESDNWAAALNAYLVALATSDGGLQLAPVGSTPNANGASFANGVLTLQPSNPGFPGLFMPSDFDNLSRLTGEYGFFTAQTVTTVDATPVSSADMLTLANAGEVGVFQAKVAARVACDDGDAADGDAAGFGLVGTFKNTTGTVTQIGSTVALWAHEDNAAWAAELEINGTALRVRCTGVAATTVNWSVTLTRLI